MAMAGGGDRRVGLMCNCSSGRHPFDELSPSLVNRAILLGEAFEGSDIEVFLYSPRDVEEQGGERVCAGWLVRGRDLVPTRGPVPRVNANWTYGTRKLLNQGMGYRRFKRWVEEAGIGVFVPYAFSELVSNKLEAYRLAEAFRPGLHPRTEDYLGTGFQAESFLADADLVFLKPRAGNKGDRIFVLRRDGDAFRLDYYEGGEQRSLGPVPLSSALGVLNARASEKAYVIQTGISSIRHEGAVFDVRVVVVNDGKDWHALLETRRAPSGSDLSNVFQGGSIHVTEDLLASVLGDETSAAVLADVRETALAMAAFLEPKFPDQLIEFGLDLVIDAAQRIWLIEINAKPGMAGYGSEHRIFEWKEEDAAAYDRWVRPHVRHLAGFLRARLDAQSR